MLVTTFPHPKNLPSLLNSQQDHNIAKYHSMVKYFVEGPPIFGVRGDRGEELRVNLSFLADLFFWEGAGLVPGRSYSILESLAQQVIRTHFFPLEFLCRSTME